MAAFRSRDSVPVEQILERIFDRQVNEMAWSSGIDRLDRRRTLYRPTFVVLLSMLGTADVRSRYNGLGRGNMRDGLPEIGRIRTLVLENLPRIGLEAGIQAVLVMAADLKKPNLHSTQAACAVTVRLTDRLGQPSSVNLWVKRVGQGRKVDYAFGAMGAVYRLLRDTGLQGPMPKRFFIDRVTGLIFMERVAGGSLLTRALKSCMPPGSPHILNVAGVFVRSAGGCRNFTTSPRTVVRQESIACFPR